MQIANSIFYRNGLSVQSEFSRRRVDVLRRRRSTAQNFADVTGTLSAVNGWANAKTNGRIPTVLERSTPDDVMFLLNAIYFKGSWRDKFDPAHTRDAPFHPATGGDQSAKLMSREGEDGVRRNEHVSRRWISRTATRRSR